VNVLVGEELERDMPALGSPRILSIGRVPLDVKLLAPLARSAASGL
jgi:hypothetical protein